MEENIIAVNLEDKIKEQRRGKFNQRRDNRRPQQPQQFEKRQRLEVLRGHKSERNQPQNPGAVVDIADLHYSVTNDELKELAESFGKVRWCKVEWDSMGRSKECASIEYFNSGDAKRAAEKLSNTTIESLPMKATLRDSTQRRGDFKRS